MLVIEQHILNGNIERVLPTEINLTNLYEEINWITREPASPLLDLDDN
jgi:hypothetical protein